MNRDDIKHQRHSDIRWKARHLQDQWRILLSVMALALAGLWALPGMAACITPGDDFSAVPAVSVRDRDPPGTLVWRSPTKITRFTCDRGRLGPAMLMINTGFDRPTAAAIDAGQIDAKIVWRRAAVPGAAVRGTQSGTAGATTSMNEGRQVQIGDFDATGYALDVTWRIELFKGAAANARGLRDLPGNVFFLKVDNAFAPDRGSFLLTLEGLNRIRLALTTCSIVALPVILPDVTVNSLTVAGRTAGEKRFGISLRNCTEGRGGAVTAGASVRTYFDGPAIDVVSGRLNADAAGARNVQVQLLNDNAARNVINLAGGTDAQNVDTVTIADGSVTLPYIARYYATGQATVGAINTRVNFTVEYP